MSESYHFLECCVRCFWFWLLVDEFHTRPWLYFHYYNNQHSFWYYFPTFQNLALLIFENSLLFVPRSLYLHLDVFTILSVWWVRWTLCGNITHTELVDCLRAAFTWTNPRTFPGCNVLALEDWKTGRLEDNFIIVIPTIAIRAFILHIQPAIHLEFQPNYVVAKFKATQLSWSFLW